MSSLRLATLFLATALALAAETEERIDKRFAVPANGRLVVDVGLGAIDVSTHAANEVIVSAVRTVTRRAKADEETYLREHPVTLTQEGDTLTLQSPRNPINSSGSWFGWLGFVSRTNVKYTVTVPATFNVRLKTSGGGIVVSDLAGETRANTSGGGLRFNRVHGPIDGRTSGGSVRVSDCTGDVKVSTSGGGIEVTGGSGSLDGHTSGGSVTVKNFRGSARVGTSGGGITLENIAGKVSGSTSGGSISARFSDSLADEVKLSTSGGSVTLHVVEAAAFQLDASTSGGGVSSDLPVTVSGKLARSRLSGPVNGGGPSVVLRSSGGGIHVKKL